MSDFDNSQPRDAFFSKRIRAGKRTYYFDVKATRGNDYYLTITESKRKPGETDDRPFFEKHKIFLYKEDFEKFTEGFHEALDYIREKRSGEMAEGSPYQMNENNGNDYAPSMTSSNLSEDFEGHTDSTERTENNREEVVAVRNSFTDLNFEDLNNIEL